MAEDSGDGAAAADSTFAAEALRIRTEAQREYAAPVLARLREIGMGQIEGATAVQVSALREYLEQTLGRPYAPAALPVDQQEEGRAIIERSGAEFRAKLDRMDATESSGSPAPDVRSGTG